MRSRRNELQRRAADTAANVYQNFARRQAADEAYDLKEFRAKVAIAVFIVIMVGALLALLPWAITILRGVSCS